MAEKVQQYLGERQKGLPPADDSPNRVVNSIQFTLELGQYNDSGKSKIGVAKPGYEGASSTPEIWSKIWRNHIVIQQRRKISQKP
jgi:hypothetical protein